jgi:hypothetical protein
MKDFQGLYETWAPLEVQKLYLQDRLLRLVATLLDHLACLDVLEVVPEHCLAEV